MTEYKNLPEKYPPFIKVFQKSLPWAVLIFLSLEAYNYYTNDARNAITLLVIFMVVYALSYNRGEKRQKQIFYSYRLTVEHDTLTRHQSNLPDISLSLNKIVRVAQLNDDFLLVTGPEKDDKIVIWPYVENFDDIRALLESYCPVTPVNYKNIFQLYPILLPFVMLLAFALAYISNNKIVVGVSALVAAVYIGWIFYKTRTSKLVDTGTKRWAWVMLVFLFFMALTVYQKLVS